MLERVAIVTGAARGIGAGIALALLESGFSVALADVDPEALKRTERSLGKLGKVIAVRTDVSRERDVASLINAVKKAFGRLDLLVNNAGLANPKHAPFERLELESWNRYLAVNLTGAFLCAKHAVPELRRSCGSIVNISSTRALMSEAHSEAYATTKGGLDALTHAMAISLGPKIRVNCIRPGWIDTRPNREAKPLPASAHKQHPSGRVGLPEDIGNLVSFLASPGAQFITGACFDVDGGMTRKMIYEG